MNEQASAASNDFGPLDREAFARHRLAELQAQYERDSAPFLKMLAEEEASKKPPVFIPLP